MRPFRSKETLKDVKTEVGAAILKDLVNEGWLITSEYSDQMFDKAIDYDSYTLKREKTKLDFEWDNWMEWTITGPSDIVTALAERYSLVDKTGTEQSHPCDS